MEWMKLRLTQVDKMSIENDKVFMFLFTEWYDMYDNIQ